MNWEFLVRAKQKITSDEISRTVWEHVLAELGPLRSFTIAARRRKGAHELRTVALTFERAP